MSTKRIHFFLNSGLSISFIIFFVSGLFILSRLFSIQVTKAQTVNFTFTAGADWGANSKTTATLNQLAGENSDFTVALGDLSYNEANPESAWGDYVKNILGQAYPFEIVAGNHDDDVPGALIENFVLSLPDYMGANGNYGREFYFDYPTLNPIARFILISPNLTFSDGITYSYAAGTEHYNWVNTAIDAARNQGFKWVIVGMHKNCITMGIKTCEIGADLLNLLVDKKVDLILQGHDHGYQRSHQLALNSNCTSIVPNTYNNNCVVDDGSDNVYTKGAGSVLVISANAGRANYDTSLTDPEAPYFAKWTVLTDPVNGYSKFSVSETQIDSQYIPSLGSFADSFIIAESGTPSPTPSPTPITETITIPVSEDASIFSANPNNNYGALSYLEIDNSPIKNFLLKFNVTGIGDRPVLSSKLKLYGKDASTKGGDFRKALDNNWSESTVTWNVAPAADTAVLASLGPVAINVWYDVNVSSAISTDGTYSFRVTSTSSDGADYSAKEGTAGFASYLLITVPVDPNASSIPSPTASPIPTLSPTPSPIPLPTPTPTPSPTPTALPTPTPTPSSVPTPSPTPSGNSIIFYPTDDTSIYLANPNSNFGASIVLQTDNSPVSNFLLKFPVSGITSPVLTAKLRLYNRSKSNIGGNFFSVLDDNWSQATMTWNNAPVADTLLGSLGPVSVNRWYEVNVTPFITGDGVYSFRVNSTSSDGADYSSLEGTAGSIPQLVVTFQ